MFSTMFDLSAFYVEQNAEEAHMKTRNTTKWKLKATTGGKSLHNNRILWIMLFIDNNICFKLSVFHSKWEFHEVNIGYKCPVIAEQSVFLANISRLVNCLYEYSNIFCDEKISAPIQKILSFRFYWKHDFGKFLWFSSFSSFRKSQYPSDGEIIIWLS